MDEARQLQGFCQRAETGHQGRQSEVSKQELAECSEVNVAKIIALKYHPQGHCHLGADAFCEGVERAGSL